MMLDQTDLGFGAFCMRDISSFGCVTLLLLLRCFEMLEGASEVDLIEDYLSALGWDRIT